MKNRILNLVIGLMGVLLAVLTVFVIVGLRDAGRVYHYDEEDFLRSVREQNYSSLLYHVYMNEADDIPTSADMEECYAAARYYEAATFYKAYLACGRTREAAEKKAIMAEQRALLGELDYAASEINKKLGLEE